MPSGDPCAAARAVREECGSHLVHLPGDPAYETGRVPWNVAIDQRPAAVARIGRVEDVVAVVRAAARHGLRVAPQGTGHGAGPMAGRDLSDVVLVRMDALRRVEIDPQRRLARVAAGALWQDVVGPAAEHGLAALHGSSPDVGVCGYTLGGGIGWYARRHGLACNALTAVELVTSEGRLVRADPAQDPELFWALRGGGGNFGVVTALEFRLFPITDAYAGMLLWDLDRAEPVLRCWANWSAQAPEEVTTALRLLRFPPLPDLPEMLRGRRLVVVDGAVLGDDEQARRLLAPLRGLAPELDTFTRMPATALTRVHMDPEGPTPSVGKSCLLEELDETAIAAFLQGAGPVAQTSLLSAELRHLGGALARRAPGAGALPLLDGAYAAFFVAVAATPDMARQGSADSAAMVEALAASSSGSRYLNLAETAVEVRDAYDTADWLRLRAVRTRLDRHGLFVANHPIDGLPPVEDLG